MPNKLSPVLNLSNNFEENIEAAYDYFQENIFNKENRPTLFGKGVFIEAHERINGKPEGFWHIISMEESHRFKVLPCVNDSSIDCCGQNCVTPCHQIVIKMGTEVRNICLLRASRLPWIIDILHMANNKDPDLKCWKMQNANKNEKLYIRYKNGAADFILIFSIEKLFYRLISAFPVFYIKDKTAFDKDYAENKWDYPI